MWTKEGIKRGFANVVVIVGLGAVMLLMTTGGAAE